MPYFNFGASSVHFRDIRMKKKLISAANSIEPGQTEWMHNLVWLCIARKAFSINGAGVLKVNFVMNLTEAQPSLQTKRRWEEIFLLPNNKHSGFIGLITTQHKGA